MFGKRLKAKIFGQVQGVFFRSYIEQAAQSLGLVGWVKNESDGSVKVVAEGDKEDLKKIIKFLKRGPNSAKITKTEIKWEKSKGEFKDFGIRY